MLKPGMVLDEKYEILKKIGKGGTAVVYLAMNQKLNQQWVVKEINGNAKDIERVLKEAKLMMQFDHPAIPRIVDILEEKEVTYIIMDYVSGQSLAHDLKFNGPKPQEVVLEWAKQICNVLDYLHSLDPPIIYHDLKPGNIILKEPEHNLKLIDFGEARPCINGDAPGGGRTKEYAAPEQQKETRSKTDQRTDIYCFGTTIYRLLTGKFPPRAPEPVGSVREQFPELQISKGMDNIIRKCTQINPEKRFSSMKELQKALENIQLWDDDYIRRLKHRINLCVGVALSSIVLAIGGIGFIGLEKNQNKQDYEMLIQTEASMDYDTKIDNYIAAIEIDGTDVRAYECLLDAYEANALFGNTQSQQITSVYNANKASFDMTSEDVLSLNYRIGRMYFNMFSGEEDSIRGRIQKSIGYFEYVCQYGDTTHENYSMASNYYELCQFFTQYVLNDSSVQEPVLTDYQNMLDALDSCLEDMQKYEAGDAAYTRLVLYEHIVNMLNVNIRGFAIVGIEQTEVKSLFEKIADVANKESITQPTSIEKREELLRQVENALDNLGREYGSLQRG